MTYTQPAKKSLADKVLERTLGLWPGYLHNKINSFDLYRSLLTGKVGLEVGGPSGIFKKRGRLPIYSVARSVDGCNFSSETVWEGQIEQGQTYRYSKSRKMGYQFVLDAVDLGAIKPASYDFVLSCHNIEPLRAKCG